MNQETTEIEVEVLEIDGIAPKPAKPATDDSQSNWNDWRQWGGQIRRLDRRWWPLWVLLGIIGLVLLLTVGLVLGAVFLVFRILAKLVHALCG